MKRQLVFTPDRGLTLSISQLKAFTHDADLLEFKPWNHPTVTLEETGRVARVGRIKKLSVEDDR